MAKISKLMTRNPKVIHPENTLQEAAGIMKRVGAGVLPVVEDNRIVGMVTDRDITVRATAAGKDPSTATVGEVMTNKAICCYGDESVSEAGKKMLSNHIGRLPVLDQRHHLSGIISLADIIAKRGGRKIVEGREHGAGKYAVVTLLGLALLAIAGLGAANRKDAIGEV